MECSTMIAFLLICAINDVFSSILKDGSQLPNRQFERTLTVNTNYDDEDNFANSQNFDYNYYEDKFQDRFYDGNHQRRIFNWLNNIIRSNSSDQVDFKVTEPKHNVFDDKISGFELGRNLTVTLTQLSQVLTEILDVIKYNKQYNFKPLHDVIKTTNFNNDRLKRHANGTVRDETILKSTKQEKNNERENITNNKKLERDEKPNIDKGIIKSDAIAIVKDKSVLNNTYLKKNNERDNVTNNKTLKRDRRRNSDKDRFERNENETLKDETVLKSTIQEKSNERDNITNGKALKRDGRRHSDIDRYKREANSTAKVESEVLNETKLEKVNERDNTTIEKELEKDGRRMMTDNPLVNSEVKERLLHYITEGFDEIKTRIGSLKNTKDMFSNDVNFRIGYIIATLESLEANMKNLRSDMDRNKFIWNDKKILNLYDTVKASNNAVGNLLEILKTYVDTTLT